MDAAGRAVMDILETLRSQKSSSLGDFEDKIGHEDQIRHRELRNLSCSNAFLVMTHDNQVLPATSGAEREARLKKRRFDAQKGLEEYRRAEAAFRSNYERLKAERLARERKVS